MIASLMRTFVSRDLLPRLPERASRMLRRASRILRKTRHPALARDTAAYLERYLPSAPSFPENLSLLGYALSQARAAAPGHICEFGVGGGRTISYISSLVPDTIVYGFYSSLGLPEDWRPGYPRGSYAMPRPPRVPTNVTLIEGLFEETVPAFLRAHAGSLCFLHVDCDLYSSTRTVLESCRDRIRAGSVIVFDEYFNYPGWREGEFRAFQEFIARTGRHYRHLGYCRDDEQLAIQIE